jgi:agmatinase
MVQSADEADFLSLNSGGYNVPLDTNPFNSWATVLDCGDIPVTSYGTMTTLTVCAHHINLLQL